MENQKNTSFWQMIEKEANMKIPAHLKNILKYEGLDSQEELCSIDLNYKKLEMTVQSKNYKDAIPENSIQSDYYGKTCVTCENFVFSRADVVTIKFIQYIAKTKSECVFEPNENEINAPIYDQENDLELRKSQ